MKSDCADAAWRADARRREPPGVAQREEQHGVEAERSERCSLNQGDIGRLEDAAIPIKREARSP